ncbi:hypothetical protein K438DRAFT_718729 [Mycena galopus ATCC 62051]|nr:hypothetical protein K438DRAFT_718729 [Mycena galopus ATCC 62051]
MFFSFFAFLRIASCCFFMLSHLSPFHSYAFRARGMAARPHSRSLACYHTISIPNYTHARTRLTLLCTSSTLVSITNRARFRYLSYLFGWLAILLDLAPRLAGFGVQAQESLGYEKERVGYNCNHRYALLGWGLLQFGCTAPVSHDPEWATRILDADPCKWRRDVVGAAWQYHMRLSSAIGIHRLASWRPWIDVLMSKRRAGFPNAGAGCVGGLEERGQESDTDGRSACLFD